MRLVVKLRGETGSKSVPAEPGTELLDVESDAITKHVAKSVVDRLMSHIGGIGTCDMMTSDDERTITIRVQSNSLDSGMRARMGSLQQTLREGLQQFNVEVPRK